MSLDKKTYTRDLKNIKTWSTIEEANFVHASMIEELMTLAEAEIILIMEA